VVAIHHRILREGEIGAGDQVTVIGRPAHGVTSALVSRAILGEPELLVAALAAPELPVDLRAWMRERARRGIGPSRANGPRFVPTVDRGDGTWTLSTTV
jgi:hypothetical protein